MRSTVIIPLAVVLSGTVWVASRVLERPGDDGAPRTVATAGRDAVPPVLSTGVASPPATPRRSEMQEAVSRFELGFAGGVLIDEGTRRTIEMATSGMSIPPTEEELARLQAALAASLPYEEVKRIMSLTRGYAGYTTELEREVPVGPEPKTLAEYDAMAARIDGIRRRHFDAETSAALFGPHDAYARIVLEASLVETDRQITGEQKLARLAELRAQLPPGQQHLVSAPAGKS